MLEPDVRIALLALLEGGPQSLTRLARWLSMDRSDVRRVLRQMRTDGLVVQAAQFHWALVAGTAPKGISDATEVARAIRPDLRDVRTVFDDGRSDVSAVPGPGAERDDASVRHGGIRTLVINGVEYDALSVGSAPVTRAYGSGSGLAASHRVTLGGRN